MKKYMTERGVTLIELVVALTILSILASVILPSAQMTGKRVREIELKRNLRTIRIALDDYKRTYDELLKAGKVSTVVNSNGYPKELKVLVEGDDFNQLGGTKKKFLRRIPQDPFNPTPPGDEPKWGLRAYKDEPDSTSWGGDDVFDVYSLSKETAIDGSKYKDW